MIAVAELDRHLRHLEAERFRDHHRHDRLVAGADVLRAAPHHDAAVRRDLAVRARAGAGPAPAVRRTTQAALDRAGRRIARDMTALPVDPLRAHRKVLRPHRVGCERRQVFQPELHRIHAHLIGELVHQHFRDETSLRMTRGAHRALLSGVDVDVGMRAPPVWKHVDVRQRIVRTRAGAAGAPRRRIKCGQLAVRADAGAHLRESGRPIARGEMLFLAIEHQLHRRIRGFCKPRAQQALHVGPELAAEPAAHELGDHAHVGLRNLEALREALARAVHRLCRHPRGEILAVPLAHATVRFERGMGLDLGGVGAVDGEGRRLEAGRQVAVFLRRALAGVCRREHLRRLRTHRLLDIGQRRQHFPFNLDHSQRVAGLLLGRGRERADLFAGKHHPVTGLDRDQHGLHARRSFSRRRVDALQARVRVWRSQDAAMEHAGPDNVVGILRAAGRLERAVDARHARAEQP